MQAHVDTFAKTTSAATVAQAITGVGFEPNIVFFMLGGPTALDTWTAGIKYSFGFAVNEGGTIKNRGHSWGADDNAATSQISKTFSNTKCICQQIGGATPTDAANIQAQAEMQSFDSDGFTLSWTKNDATATQIAYLALSVPSVAVRDLTTPSAPGTASITGLSFAPNAIFAISGTNGSYQTTAPVANIFIGFGWAAEGSDQQATHWQESDNQTTTATSMYHRTSLIHARHSTIITPGTALNQSLTVSAWNSDGITVNAAAATEARILEVLLIGGTEVFAETFAKSTGGAPASQSRTGYGFQPKAALVVSGSKTADTTSTQHIRESIGFSDGANEASLTYYDTSALSDSNANARITASKSVGTVTTNTDAIASAADVAFTSDGIDFTWTTNDANAHEVFPLAFGDTPVAGTARSQIINVVG